MDCFEFYNPTRVIFGAGVLARAGEQLRREGGSRVLVLCGGGSAVKNGTLAAVERSLAAAGLEWECVGGIRPNPLAQYAQRIVDEHRDGGFDCLLAVGGGSVIDTAKAVSYGLARPEVPLWEYYAKRAVPEVNLPLGVVLTIAAAGSETSDSSVLTNAHTGEKRGLSTPLNRPKFALMDPGLTLTLPARQTACGVTDIIMHTLDRYFAAGCGNLITDQLARAVLRTAITCGRRLTDDPNDLDARAQLMWAGSLSHNGLTGLGQTKDFSVHQLGHELSGRFDLPHGESLSAMWGTWARYVRDTDVARFAQYAREIWDVGEQEDEAAADAGIAATESFFAALGMPVTLGQAVGVQEEQTLRELAHSCSFKGTRTVGTFRPLGEEDIFRLYSLSNHL